MGSVKIFEGICGANRAHSEIYIFHVSRADREVRVPGSLRNARRSSSSPATCVAPDDDNPRVGLRRHAARCRGKVRVARVMSRPVQQVPFGQYTRPRRGHARAYGPEQALPLMDVDPCQIPRCKVLAVDGVAGNVVRLRAWTPRCMVHPEATVAGSSFPRR